jgi:hypothetical protein
MIVDNNQQIPFLYDQAVNFLNGVDTAKAPDLISEGYSSFAVNTSFRGGKPSNRPAFHEFVLPNQPNLEWFRYKKHQGDTLYRDLTNDVSYMVSVRGGKIFKVDLTTGIITQLGTEVNTSTRRHYFQQADKFLIIQNGEEVPLIWDGVTLRRARTANGKKFLANNVSITKVGTNGFVVTNVPHNLSIGDWVRIDEPISLNDYVGDYFVYQVVSPTEYRITVNSAIAALSDAAGTITNPAEAGITSLAYRPGNRNTSISNPDGNAVVTTSNPHGLGKGDYVTIFGPITDTGYAKEPYPVETIISPTQYVIKVDAALNSITDPNTAGTTYRPKEVPIGLYMEYLMRRLCVVSPDRKTINFSDQINTTPDTLEVDSVLWFTEEDFLEESYKYSLPIEQGRIRAISTIPNLDNTSVGIGEGQLFVAGDSGISTINLSFPREEWLEREIQKIALTNVGAASHTGFIGYNGDLLFRDLEYGIRSYRLAGARFTKNPSQAPISAEMNRLFLDDDVDKLLFSCLEVFDNRLISTVTPVANFRRVRVTKIESIGTTSTITLYEDVPFVPGDRFTTEGTALDTVPHGQFIVIQVLAGNKVVIMGTNGANQTTAGGTVRSEKTGSEFYHRGLTALDYTTLSGAGGETSAAWEGLWTGLNTQSIVKAEVGNKLRCFVTHYNDVLDRNEIWEITKEVGPDLPEGYDEENPIYPEAYVELSAMDCDKEFNLKRLLGLNLFLSNIRSNLKVSVYYRNDGDPCWINWTDSEDDITAEICALVDESQGSETNPSSRNVEVARPQGRLLRIGQPFFNCQNLTDEDSRLFYETQLKIKWTGIATIDKVRLMTMELIEDMRGRCY